MLPQSCVLAALSRCQAGGQAREVTSSSSASVTSPRESRASTRFRCGESEERAGTGFKLSYLLPHEPNVFLDVTGGSFSFPFLLLGGHWSGITGSFSGALG